MRRAVEVTGRASVLSKCRATRKFGGPGVC